MDEKKRRVVEIMDKMTKDNQALKRMWDDDNRSYRDKAHRVLSAPPYYMTGGKQ